MGRGGIQVELDFFELWVGDLSRAARVLRPFGFEPESEPATSRPDAKVESLVSGNVRLVLCEGTSENSPIARHVADHGDGVGDVGLVTRDLDAVVERARARGLDTTLEDGSARVDLLGDGTLLHSLRERSAFPHVARGPGQPRPATSMRGIDHMTYCVPFGAMDEVAPSYREVFGLEDVPVEGCEEVGDLARGMRSLVLRAPLGFTVVLTEPRSSAGSGQTEQFLRVHGGAGVQHVAVAYDDLVSAVVSLRSNGVAFLPVPAEELERAHARLRDRDLGWERLKREQILVDADEGGFLFQLFTEPISPGSGFFFELIERAGATGFGAGNVRGLFAALDAAMRAEENAQPSEKRTRVS